MRQHIFHILFILLLTMAFPFHSSGKDNVIDFNFPQDVSKNALTDLDKALKSGDGQLTVDALVRYSVAQSGISQDNMPDITAKLENTIDKEKQPHIKALLYHLEALIYQGYRDRYVRWSDRNNPVEETPDDVSEWDRKQFDKKIAELIDKSLAYPAALKQVAVTELPNLIQYNELGATYGPTLHEFLLMKGKEMLEQSDLDDETLVERIKADWLATTEDNVPAHLYALTQVKPSIPIETYRQYQGNIHCACLLNNMSWENEKAQYKTLSEYVERFPNSIYTPEVKNRITQLENKHVNLYYPEVRSSRDSITVKADVRNTNAFNVVVYRIPSQEYNKTNFRLDKSKLQLVSTHPVKVQGNVPFYANEVVTKLPPLPYGAYIICPELEEGSTSESGVSRYNILSVTDIAAFTVSRSDHQDCVVTVDINTGKPLSGVTITTYQGRELGVTNTDGTLAIPTGKFDRGTQLTASKGNDRNNPPFYYSPINNPWNENNSAMGVA